MSEDVFVKNFWRCFNDFQDSAKPDSPGMPAYFRFLTLLSEELGAPDSRAGAWRPACLGLLVSHALPWMDPCLLVATAGRQQPPPPPMPRLGTGLRIFLEERVDVVILEVGLGGRLDATNCIPHPVVCGIASLGFDHMDLLGHTLPVSGAGQAGHKGQRKQGEGQARRTGPCRQSAKGPRPGLGNRSVGCRAPLPTLPCTLQEIAGEKAGIMKPGRPVVTVQQLPEAAPVLDERARQLGCPLSVAPSLAIYSPDQELPELGLHGAHQAINASLAVALARAWEAEAGPDDAARHDRLRCLDQGCLPPAYLSGLASVTWPGRGQVWRGPEGRGGGAGRRDVMGSWSFAEEGT